MTDQTLDDLIKSKLDELDKIPFGPKHGRRLELNFSQQSDTHRGLMERSLRDLADRVSMDFVRKTPVVALEQFIIMSAVRNEDTAGMLVSLVNSFMAAYLTPEFSDLAFQHLEGLEAAKKQVSNIRTKKASLH